MDTRATETVEPILPDNGLERLPVGTLLAGRFELAGVIGSGGYATVYEARDRKLGRRVAIKVLRGDRVTPSSVARMRREVAVAREVTSPRLVKVYDIGEDGPLTFISMELVEGTSLRDLVARDQVPLDETLRIADQILESLSTLHERGIVHRDLKPANILLTTNGEVKLADFGLARHWENEQMRVTHTDGLVGTMEYLSPEQALGRDLDPRSDLYSFGVVLYEMLAGALPFGGASSLGTVVAHVTAHAPDIRRSRSDLPLWISLLVRRLLEKNIDLRPASAAEVRELLRSRKIDWGYRWKRSRVRTLSIALIATAALASAWMGWAWYESRFDRIASDGGNTLHAYDRKGRVLWSKPNSPIGQRAAVVNVSPGERRVVVAPLDDPGVPDAGQTARPLLLLDPQTGSQSGVIQLPSAPRAFPVSPSFNLIEVLPVDTNHDGSDELVASYIHFYWPSYSLLIDPRAGQAGVMLYASGHHRPLGTIDVDGDGVDEVLFSGPNNRMGWRDAVAAVRAEFVTPGESRAMTANTPDAVYSETATALVWYTLLPRKRVYGTTLENVRQEARTFDLVNEDGSRTTLTFDGFIAGSGTPDSTPARQAARLDAYALLRDAQLKESLGEFPAALDLGRRAGEAAARAGETELEGWISTSTARVLARARRPDAEIDQILETSGGGPELCWEVARVFSLEGEPRRAADWFMRAFSLTPREWIGHPPADYLTEAVIALAEIHAWNEALDLVDRYAAGYTQGFSHALRMRTFIAWRTGGRVSEPLPYSTDIHWRENYWRLEYLWSTETPDPARFLERLKREIHGAEDAPWIRSLEAEVLFRLGRTDEALPIVRQAWEAVNADPTDAAARVHREVVEARLREIEAAAPRR